MPLPSRVPVGTELATLVAPMSVDEFRSRYWGRRALFIKGSREKLSALLGGPFGRREFEEAVRAGEAPSGHLALYSSEHHLGARGRSEVISPSEMRARLQRGATMRAHHVRDSRLAHLATAIKSQVGHAGVVCVGATLSPSGSGFPPHFDRVSSLFVQCTGRKRFQISPRPILRWPRDNVLFTRNGRVAALEAEAERGVRGFAPRDLVTFELEPGDALYAPPGTVHATTASGSEALNLNFPFEHSSLLPAIHRALETRLASSPWRHIPTGNAAALDAFVARRLEEAHRETGRFAPAAFALRLELERLIADPGEQTRASLTPLTAMPHVRIARRDRLRVARRGSPRLVRGRRSTVLLMSGEEIEVWGPARRVLERIGEGLGDFRALDVLDGLRTPVAWGEARRVLTTLLHRGVIELT